MPRHAMAAINESLNWLLPLASHITLIPDWPGLARPALPTAQVRSRRFLRTRVRARHGTGH